MKNTLVRSLCTLIFAMCFVFTAYGRTSEPRLTPTPCPTPNPLPANVYQGYSVILDAPDSGGCGVTYGQDITVTKMDGTAPADCEITLCDGTGVRQNGSGDIVIPRDPTTGFWCFRGSASSYKIKYNGVPSPGGTPIPFIWFPNSSTTGFFNVKDFGAKGDGTTDDTHAIKNALAFIAARHGGTLYFPEGDYIVGGGDYAVADFKGITLPSGVIIEGSSSMPSTSLSNYFGEPKSSCRIRLKNLTTRTRARVFRIGECTQRVAIRNIELKSGTVATEDGKSYGIEALGRTYDDKAGTGFSSQDILFENMTLSNFDIGMYVHDVDPSDHAWQFDYVEVRHCRFTGNKIAGISLDLSNSDWKIDHCIFAVPQKNVLSGVPADGLYVYRGGMITIVNTFGGAESGIGGDFIHTEYPGNLTIINSQCEKMSRSLFYGDSTEKGVDNASYPLTLINNIFGNDMDIYKRTTFVSTGNLYGPDNVTTYDKDIRIYSTGDRFCYDGEILGCDGSSSTRGDFQGEGIVIFRTAQPKDGSLETTPTRFGFDVEMRLSDDTIANDADLETTPLLSLLSSPNWYYDAPDKPLLRIGDPTAYYDVQRNTSGILTFKSGPTYGLTPYRGFSFDRPVKLPTYSYSDLSNSNMTGYFSTMGVGTMIFCTDCKQRGSASSATCEGSGGGTIAVVNFNGSTYFWQCQ